jgi:hypothetical protein
VLICAEVLLAEVDVVVDDDDELDEPHAASPTVPTAQSAVTENIFRARQRRRSG